MHDPLGFVVDGVAVRVGVCDGHRLLRKTIIGIITIIITIIVISRIINTDNTSTNIIIIIIIIMITIMIMTIVIVIILREFTMGGLVKGGFQALGFVEGGYSKVLFSN